MFHLRTLFHSAPFADFPIAGKRIHLHRLPEHALGV
jgi:hypothetical protein